ncbi:MAG: FG-GAP repeat protein [Proteobacteria bacterium]|nr:FG-GAP repeat protein [Pseudomonadota bacterium]
MRKKVIPLGVAAALVLSSWAYGEGSGKPVEWKLEPGRVIGGNSLESGARLMDPVLVDMDGDGLQDLVFGAPGASPNGVQAAGSVYVIRGKKDMPLEGKTDVTDWLSFDYRFDGHTPNGMLGMNILTGDFNGDGFKDIAVAAPGGKGAVYLIYGGAAREKGIYDIDQKEAGAVSFVSSEIGASLGIQGCVGDFNRDGIDDIALAQVVYNANLANNSSQVVMLTMRREWDKASYDINSKLYGKTVLTRPVSSHIRVVHSCAVGDFNDDGIADIALGMPLDATQGSKTSGSVTVVYHPYKYIGTNVDLSQIDDKIGIRINGSQAGAQFGYSVAAGDYTGDGRDDLAVSAPGRLVKGPKSEGAVYILDANYWPEQSGEQPNSLQITGKGGMFGYRIQTADVNGDKRPDLVIAAPGAGNLDAGVLSVYLGGQHFIETLENNARADIEVAGGDFMNFGLGSAFGDFNGDGKFDAVVRTGADPFHRQQTGAFAVIGNFSELPQASALSDNFMTVLAPSKGGGLDAGVRSVHYNDKDYRVWFSPKGMRGRSLICLMDASRALDGDYAIAGQETCDIQIVGPAGYAISDFTFSKSPTGKPLLTIAVPDMPVQKAVGFVAVIPLPDEITQPLVLNLSEATLKTEAQTFILSHEQASMLGAKLEWFDLNQDGYDDLIIGAPKRNIDAETCGSVFIVMGKAERKHGYYELTGKEVIQYEGFMNEEFGDDWRILDFNVDRRPDLFVHAAHTPDASGEEHSTIYGIYSAGGRAPKAYSVKSPDIATIRISAPQNRSGLKIVHQDADVNADGNIDLLMISPDYRAGLQKQGAVFAVFSDAENKSGDMPLSDETHIGFSFTPGRNERLVDARFVWNAGIRQFLVVSRDLMTGLNSTVNTFEDTSDKPFLGAYTASKLKRRLSEGRIPKPLELILIQDVEQQQDELWFVFPYDGLTQSGQGIAQKVAPWE